MAKKSSEFDEAAFLAAMSQGHSFAPDTTTLPVNAPPQSPQEVVALKSKRSRRERISNYESKFLQPQEPIKNRSFVGLRPELYEVIVTIVKRIGSGVSAQAFVENVLRDHLEQYQDEINRLNRERMKKDIV
jgi:hypothetical protein